MQSSPLPCYLIPLGPKYPPQHFILENPQPTLRWYLDTEIRHQPQNTILTCLMFYDFQRAKCRENVEHFSGIYNQLCNGFNVSCEA
jgi:hypothetical protein